MISDYHTKLYANELSLKAPIGTIERIANTLFDSRVDLNPHQVDAALFAFKSPLSKGALLADEVGLGKTIEAGILIAQKWAEGKKRIIIILPASLRKQWLIELEDKFNLPSVILEAKSFNDAIKNGNLNPFDTDKIVLTSFAFARNKEAYLKQTPWDFAVIDEAHRLRNVSKSVVAKSIKSTLKNIPKILLTATPLQNNIKELYGLVSIIDEHIFGDEKSFKEHFENQSQASLKEIKSRLENVCKRTLRKQVLKYIKYTKRLAHTQEFYSGEKETELYNLVSDYLQRESLKALPNSQRKLMTMILRKLLASSTYAISGTLERLIYRLENILSEDIFVQSKDVLDNDFETIDEYDEPCEGEEEYIDLTKKEPLSKDEKEAIKAEIEDLKGYLELARSIKENSKGKALLKALDTGFNMAKDLGADKKAIIFTESRRTQDYIFKLLNENGFEGKIMLFNGTNTDKLSQSIYKDWKAKNSDRQSGSKAADMRTALVEYFKNNAQIMIATEAAAEGINLQFCSLVINYDLPWNPQRIEQRIGRCHRYGQKHDVVVVNFLNLNNQADQRVYALLKDKLQLFDGVFGASDEVLGALGSGLDFERKIAELYQKCRSSNDIQIEFDFIQKEFAIEIQENVRQARKKLLENFDAEVAERLNVYQEASNATINKVQALLWGLTQHELGGTKGVFFDMENLTFQMPNPSEKEFGGNKIYAIKRTSEHCEQYGISHPLAQLLIKRAIDRDLPLKAMVFDYKNFTSNINVLEKLTGKSGKLSVSKLSIGGEEEHLIFSCIDDLGNEIEAETARRLFNLNCAKIYDIEAFNAETEAKINSVEQTHKSRILAESLEKNTKFFDSEVDKLEQWAQDRKNSLETKLKELDKEISILKKSRTKAANLDEKLAMQCKQRDLESERMKLRQKLFQAQDDIDDERDALIAQAQNSLNRQSHLQTIFSIQWSIV